jgi:hypothetical protein
VDYAIQHEMHVTQEKADVNHLIEVCNIGRVAVNKGWLLDPATLELDRGIDTRDVCDFFAWIRVRRTKTW